jgi:glutamine cyclotransferase
MRITYLKYFIFPTFILLITWIISCSGRTGKKVEKNPQPAAVMKEGSPARLIKIVSPDENSGFKLNDQIKVVLAQESKSVDPDSVKIWFDGKSVAVLTFLPWECGIPSLFTGTTGRKALKIIAYKGNKKPQIITRFMIIYSDVIPKRNGFKIINTYPHDKEAFTQGLFYDNGMLYEGTGQVSESSLRKVELETGRVLNQFNLEPQLFGEGITLMADKIFELTWETKVGFVYDKATFKVINKIYYQTEGWGLTTMDDKLIMSDGTNVLYFMEPELFTVVSKIEVYDNQKKVDKLNELEFIDGEIWANIWQTNLIARVDPQSGKVIAYIDMKGILSDPETDTSVNVLNGIAYDAVGKRIFVTGKNWPKLFEIRITE